MTLSWKDTMVAASFRGLEFPATRIQLNFGHALALNSYPDVGGQDVEDQGRNAEHWTVDFIFAASLADTWGDDIYPERWRGFKRRLDTKGSGELVLPDGGSVQAAVDTGSIIIDATKEDQISGTVTFVEDSLGAFAITDSTSLSREGEATKKAEAIDLYLQSNEGIDSNPFTDLLGAFTMVLFAAESTRYTVESAYLRAMAEMQTLISTYSVFADPAHWDVMELTIQFNSYMVDMVSGVERDFPTFKTTTVKGEIDLMTLAMQLYGDRDRWEELHSLNASAVPNPLRVPAGTEIVYAAV